MPEIPIRRRSPAEVRERFLAAGLPGDFVNEVIAPDSRVLERQRLVADAIILERAARVLQRRLDPQGSEHEQTEWTVITFLRYRAEALRLEAGDA